MMGGLAVPALARKERAWAAPELILIVADGLGSWMLGCGGNREIRTPNIDQLAQSGTRFENHLPALRPLPRAWPRCTPDAYRASTASRIF